VKTEEVLQTVKEERNILHTMKCRNSNWIFHTLCRKCLPKQHIIEGKIEGTGSQGRSRKLLWDDLKEVRRY
jgi:hypothetical protein